MSTVKERRGGARSGSGQKPRVAPEAIEAALQGFKEGQEPLITLANRPEGLCWRLKKSDKECAEIVSSRLGAEVTRGQINSFRRRHYVAGYKVVAALPEDSGHGGSRVNSGRANLSISVCLDSLMDELKNILGEEAEKLLAGVVSPSSKELQEILRRFRSLTHAETHLLTAIRGVVINYSDSKGALELLHILDTWQLSQDCRGQGLVGGPKVESPEAKELKEILRKLKLKKYKDEHESLKNRAREIAQTVGKTEVSEPEKKTEIETIFEEANTGQGTAALGKKGKQGGRGTLRKIS